MLPDEIGRLRRVHRGCSAPSTSTRRSTTARRRSTTPNGQPIADPFGQPGFPGFDGMFAKNTLGEVAQMQEAGVPVTFALHLRRA